MLKETVGVGSACVLKYLRKSLVKLRASYWEGNEGGGVKWGADTFMLLAGPGVNCSSLTKYNSKSKIMLLQKWAGSRRLAGGCSENKITLGPSFFDHPPFPTLNYQLLAAYIFILNLIFRQFFPFFALRLCSMT
jgi:hypothetical protein